MNFSQSESKSVKAVGDLSPPSLATLRRTHSTSLCEFRLRGSVHIHHKPRYQALACANVNAPPPPTAAPPLSHASSPQCSLPPQRWAAASRSGNLGRGAAPPMESSTSNKPQAAAKCTPDAAFINDLDSPSAIFFDARQPSQEAHYVALLGFTKAGGSVFKWLTQICRAERCMETQHAPPEWKPGGGLFGNS